MATVRVLPAETCSQVRGLGRMFTAFGCLVYPYRLIVVAVWAIVMLVAGPIATRVFQVLGADGFSSSELEATRADAVLAHGFGFDPGTLFLIYEDPQGQLLANDPRYARAAVLTSVRGGTTVARMTTRFGQTDDRSKALVRAIRATPPPDGFTLLVGGGTAGVIGYVDTLCQEFPRAAAFVVAAIYGVLFVMFRSVVLPFKPLVMNSLSLLASYGALVVVFQDGFGADLLRFRPLGLSRGRCPSCSSACCSACLWITRSSSCHASKKRTTRERILSLA